MMDARDRQIAELTRHVAKMEKRQRFSLGRVVLLLLVIGAIVLAFAGAF